MNESLETLRESVVSKPYTLNLWMETQLPDDGILRSAYYKVTRCRADRYLTVKFEVELSVVSKASGKVLNRCISWRSLRCDLHLGNWRIVA